MSCFETTAFLDAAAASRGLPRRRGISKSSASSGPVESAASSKSPASSLKTVAYDSNGTSRHGPEPLKHWIRPPSPVYPAPSRYAVLGRQIPARRPRRSARRTQERLDAFRSSGLSLAAFSRQHGTAQSLLSLHLEKASRSSSHPHQKPSSFLEVELSSPSPEPTGYRITFSSGLLLDVLCHFQSAERSAMQRVVVAAGFSTHPVPA